jgi:hypothetical protein
MLTWYVYISVFCTGKWFLFRHLFFRVIRCAALLRLPLNRFWKGGENAEQTTKKKNAAQTLRAPDDA